MKKQFLAICLILVSCVFANAQNTGTNVQATKTEAQNAMNRQQQAQQQRESQRAQPSIPGMSVNKVPSAATMRRTRKLLKTIYRNTTKEELAMIAPNNEDVVRFSEFLKQSNTGLFKLVPNAGCFINEKIVVAKPECQKYTLPGYGSSYSFRVNTYRIPSVADLVYKDDKFTGGESLTQKIFVEIGNVPLEEVSLQTDGIKFLVDFETKADENKFKEIAGQLADGIEKDGFQYRSSLNVNAGSTYLLRSVAYEGMVLRSFDGETYYNELDWDKRKDIIVAFRVVRKDDKGNVTILWKELDKKDAPQIK